MSSRINIALFLFLIGIPAYKVFPQDGLTVPGHDSLVPLNTVTIGMDKLINTYLFSLNSYLNFPVYFGYVKIFESYRGTAIRTSDVSFRDDQGWMFEYGHPIGSHFVPIFRQNWIYTNDTK